MALAFLEGKVVTSGSTPATTPAFTNALAVGQIVVVFIGYDTGTAGLTTSVTDSKGNTYTQVPSFYTSGTGIALDCWRSTVTAGHTGASPTVSVAFNDATASTNVVVQIFNGFTGTPTYDKMHTSANASSTNATSGATATISQAVELVVGGAVHASTASAFTADVNYGNLTQSSVSARQTCMQSRVTSSAAAQTSIPTIAANRVSIGGVVTFYDYVVAGGSAIKTINGLVYASIGKVNGLAIASVKTINGLA